MKLRWTYFLPFIGLIYFPLFYFIRWLLSLDNDILVAIIGGSVAISAALLGLIGVIIADVMAIRKLDRHLGFEKTDASLKKQLGVDEKSISAQLGVDEKSISAQLGVDEKSISTQLGVNEKSISAQLGVNEKSISTQLGVNCKSITEQLGVDTNTKSLTRQHEDIYGAVCEQRDKISTIAGIIHDSQIRQETVNLTQENLAATLSAFQQSYVSAINANTQLTAENQLLKDKNAELQNNISELQSQLSDSEDDEEQPSM